MKHEKHEEEKNHQVLVMMLPIIGLCLAFGAHIVVKKVVLDGTRADAQVLGNRILQVGLNETRVLSMGRLVIRIVGLIGNVEVVVVVGLPRVIEKQQVHREEEGICVPHAAPRHGYLMVETEMSAQPGEAVEGTTMILYRVN